jgi:hypothetical protein
VAMDADLWMPNRARSSWSFRRTSAQPAGCATSPASNSRPSTNAHVRSSGRAESLRQRGTTPPSAAELCENPDMTVDDFRRIALSLEGVEESSHMGQPNFRVGGRIFATLASASQGYGNVKLTLEQQAALVEEMPEVFVPIPGGWGRMGMTHVRLAAASEDVLAGALRAAWKLRLERNAKAAKGARRAKAVGPAEVLRKKSRDKA